MEQTPSHLQARVVEIVASVGTGKPREVRVLLDEPGLKLATIVLRGGAVLPEHRSEGPATIVALQGSGAVIAGAERLPIDPTHAVLLASGVRHSVEPDAGSDLVLLVHRFGRADAPG